MLTTTLERGERAELGLPLGSYDVVLANPPVSGVVGATTATELPFLKYMSERLK